MVDVVAAAAGPGGAPGGLGEAPTGLSKGKLKPVVSQKAVRAKARARRDVDRAIELLGQACVALVGGGVSPDRWLRVQRLAKIAGVLSRELADNVAALRGRGAAGPIIGGMGIYNGNQADALDYELGDEGGGAAYPQMIGAPNDNVQLVREMIPALQKLAENQGKLPAREANAFDLSSAIHARDTLVEKKESTEEIDAYIAAVKASLKRQAAELGQPREDLMVKAGHAFGQHVIAPLLGAGGEQPLGPGAMVGDGQVFPLGPNA